MNPVDDTNAVDDTGAAAGEGPAAEPQDAPIAVGLDADSAGTGVGDLPDELEIAERLARAERKPPLYRFFRGTLYGLYLAVTLWLFLAIVISWTNAVWGDAGDAMRAQQDAPRPLAAAPRTGEVLPAARVGSPGDDARPASPVASGTKEHQ